MSDFFRFICRALALLLAATTLSLAWGTPAHAADPGELEGTLTTSDGGSISGTLAIYQWQAGEQYFDYQGEVTFGDEASPAAYSFAGLPAGQYYLEFSDDTSVYGQTYSGAATAPPESLGDPGVVQLGASGATVNMSLAARQQVFGTVVNASGAGIDHVYITASLQTPSGPAYVDAAETVDGGAFDLFLRPGTYDLELSDTDARYRETTVTVTVTPTTETLAPITMTLVPTWTYSGKVVDGAGTGIPGARVRLHQLIGQAGDFWDYTTGPVVSADSTGKYTFTNLTDGQFYTVGASAYRHATSVLGGGTDPTEGTAFRATQNRPTLPNLTLADATGLTGSVSSAFGPSEGVTVELIRWVEAWGAFTDAGAATTGSTGTYRFDELVPGTYAVHIDAAGAARPLKSIWLGGGDEPSTSTDPRLFTVGAVPTEIRKDVVLAARQVARGRVTSDTGAVLAGTTVASYSYNGETNSWTPYASVPTASDGSFAVPVPADSTVTFRFSRSGYATRYLDGSASAPAFPSGANHVATGPDDDVTLGADVELTPVVSPPPVVKKSSTTSAKLAKKKIPVGKSTKVTITVKGSGTTAPTGSVQVFDGKKRLTTVTLTAAKRGILTVTLRKPKKGKHKIHATYAGSGTLLASASATVTLTVTKKKKR